MRGLSTPLTTVSFFPQMLVGRWRFLVGCRYTACFPSSSQVLVCGKAESGRGVAVDYDPGELEADLPPEEDARGFGYVWS